MTEWHTRYGGPVSTKLTVDFPVGGGGGREPPIIWRDVQVDGFIRSLMLRLRR